MSFGTMTMILNAEIKMFSGISGGRRDRLKKATTAAIAATAAANTSVAFHSVIYDCKLKFFNPGWKQADAH